MYLCFSLDDLDPLRWVKHLAVEAVVNRRWPGFVALFSLRLGQEEEASAHGVDEELSLIHIIRCRRIETQSYAVVCVA